MTFFNKIIDKAKHHGHHTSQQHQQLTPQPSPQPEEAQKNSTASTGTHATNEQSQIKTPSQGNQPLELVTIHACVSNPEFTFSRCH